MSFGVFFAKAFGTTQLLVPILTAHGEQCDELSQRTVSQVALDPDIFHEDTALFPGQRCEML